MRADPPLAPPSLSVLEVAADWLDRLEALSPQEDQVFRVWLTASDENRRAFETLKSVLDDPALEEAVARIRAQGAEPIVRPLFAKARHSRGSHTLSRRTGSWGVAPWIALPIAASLALVIAVTLRLQPMSRPVLARYAAQPIEYQTPIGVRADTPLTDRSVIHLDARSAVKVSFTDHRRRVWLERGEAMFEVSHDPGRPFDVDAGGATVTAVGTLFDVELLENFVDVRVFEGVVRVRDSSGMVRALRSGEELVLGAAGSPVFRQFTPDLSRTWRANWLSADNMPLSQVVARLNRYSAKPIVLKSQDLSDLTLSGRFNLGRTDATIAMLSALLDLDVTRDERGVYLAHRAIRATHTLD